MSASNNSFVVKNGLVVNNNLLVANNGKVGVNTASPDAALTVVGSANVQGDFVATGNIATTTLNANTAGIHTGNVSASVVNASANVFTNTVFATNVNASFVNTSTANVTGNFRVGGLSTLVGNTTVGNSSVLSDLQVFGNLYVTGTTISVGTSLANGDVVPTVTETYKLGNSSAVWSETYTKIATIGNSTSSATINSTAFSGTAANATLFAGQSLATVQGWITGNAATAYSNVTSWQFANATNGFGISGTAANANNLGNVPASSYINTSGSYTITGAHTYNSTVFVNGSILSVGNTTQNVTTNTTVIVIGNSTVNATINSTAFTGKANDATNYTGSISSGQVTSALGFTPYNATNPSLLANSTNGFGISGTAAAANTANNASFLGGTAASGYQTTAGLSANVATLTSNNTSFVGTVSAANVVSNAQLTSNLTSYAKLSGAAFTGQVNTSANLNLSGTAVAVGNGAGLTSVSYISTSTSASDISIFVGGDQNTWKDGSTFYPTVATGVSTLAVGVSAGFFIKQVADEVAASGDVTAGPGNPQLIYRIVKVPSVGANTVLYTSSNNVLSTPGAGGGFLVNTVDTTPVSGNSTGYAIQYKWQDVSADPNANAGTITTANNTTANVSGTGTYFTATLNSRLQIATANSTGGNAIPYVNVSTVYGNGLVVLEAKLGSKVTANNYVVRDQYANVVMDQTDILFTFVGYK